MARLTIKTNNVPRDIIDAYELTHKEREQFDYLDWGSLDDGGDSASFVRYKGMTYDLAEFTAIGNGGELSNAGWHGAAGDSYFSGVLIKIVDGGERVIVGRYYS